MKCEYLFDDEEFNESRRARNDYEDGGNHYTIEEEKVRNQGETVGTVFRVFEGEEIVAAATYLNGLEGRTEDEFNGMGEPLNETEYDNVLHAVNQITGGKLAERDFSTEDQKDYEGEQLELLPTG